MTFCGKWFGNHGRRRRHDVLARLPLAAATEKYGEQTLIEAGSNG